MVVSVGSSSSLGEKKQLANGDADSAPSHCFGRPYLIGAARCAKTLYLNADGTEWSAFFPYHVSYVPLVVLLIRNTGYLQL